MEDLPTDIATFVDTHLVDRHNSNAVKWDGLKEEFGRADLLPMWIADTEFKAPQAVLDALTARVKEGTFGYSIITKPSLTGKRNDMALRLNLSGCVLALALSNHCMRW